MVEIKNKYPLVIIGGGPAGMTASIYASRFKVENLVVAEALGGLASEAHKVCNFPTELEINGMELANKIQEHAEKLGASVIIDKIVGISELEDGSFKLTAQSNKEFYARAILLAVGTERRKLDLPDEAKFLGRGVSYCATCDAMFYKNKTVAVIGGSNSAHTASLYLAEVADKVYQIYRGDKLRGEAAWVEQIRDNKKIELILNTEVKGLIGKEKLEGIILNKPYSGKSEIKVDGLFVEIGTVPQKVLIKELNLATNENGYIKVDVGQKTNQNGVWAAGDITDGSNNFRQIITACSEGAIAAENIFKYLQSKK